MASDFAVEPLSEDALLLRFGDCIDAAVNARVHAAARALRGANLAGIIEIAPAYATLLLRFDPFAWTDPKSARPFERITAALRRILVPTNTETLDPGAAEGRPALSLSKGRDDEQTAGSWPDAVPRLVEIPVCYGGEYGPDLDAVVEHAGRTSDGIIARHTAGDYTVAMLGFAPGFPYLLGLDSALHVPRRANPRTRVPAGSVAIGGAQTGIYPRDLPGGWNLIGRTPIVLFDPQSESPCLLAPGDRVRFRAIGKNEFDMLYGKYAQGGPSFGSRDRGRSQG